MSPQGFLGSLSLSKVCARGVENKSLTGRSEQVSVSGGLANTYACSNCCPDSVYQTWLDPSWIQLEFGSTAFIGPLQTDINCYSTLFGPFTPSPVLWNSDNVNVVSVFDGELVTEGAGTANISAAWETVLWWVLDGNCEPIYDQVIQYAPVEVAPRVTINVPPTAVDGSTANFSVTVNGATATGFGWSFEAPFGAGNNPQVNFAFPNEPEPIAVARWFALPNDPCLALINSTYRIRVTVSHSGGETFGEADFTVTLPEIAGGVPPPAITGEPSLMSNGFGQPWYVAGPGNLTRETPPILIFIPATSQFYNKVFQHELKHQHQYVSGIAQNYFLVSSFYSAIQSLTASSKELLETSIMFEFTNWRFQQRQQLESDLGNQMEDEAYAVSDLIDPRYAYQSCDNNLDTP